MRNNYKKLSDCGKLQTREDYFVSYAIRGGSGCNCNIPRNWPRGDMRTAPTASPTTKKKIEGDWPKCSEPWWGNTYPCIP